MIDIITGSERNLRDIRQIGSPSDEDRIYIENTAYGRIHEDDYAEKRIFILMGHTECAQGRYTTFIEAAIPVRDIDFVQNIPQWNNHAWSDVFREIKRSYEDSIIVGWAMDIKGFLPRMNPDLEAVHREQFGGAHQLLFLMDSIEGEEYFYINKGNRLQQRSGFYIYFCPKLHEMRQAEVTLEVPQESSVKVIPAGAHAAQHSRVRIVPSEPQEKERQEETQGNISDIAEYRDAAKKEKNKGERKASSYAMAAAIALLLGIVGTGIYQERIKLSGLEEVISTMGIRLEKDKTDEARGSTDDAQVLIGTELKEEDSTQQDMTETLSLIPVKQLPSGEIKTIDETQNTENTQSGDTETDTEKSSADKKDSAKKEKTKEDDSKTDKSGKAEETGAPAAEYYTVQTGDTLTAICTRLYGSTANIDKIVTLNKLDDSDDIRVGQKLLLP